jgi:phage regulator Rha-like protein
MPESTDNLNMPNRQIEAFDDFGKVDAESSLPVGRSSIPTMTSREIADLVSVRHDNVRRTIEALAERGVITLPQIEEKPTAGRPSLVYVFTGAAGKRDSIVTVAQLSPEFTARLVDRWQELENSGFSNRFRSHAQPKVDVARECRLTLSQNLRLAKMMGFTGNQALLSANRATVAMTGIDTLSLMGSTHLTAPQNEALLSPSDIGARAGIGSARVVNKRLCELGLQQQYRDSKGHAYYEPTETGRALGGVLQDTGKRHSTGTPVRQLRWASSILRTLQDPVSLAA